MMMVQYLLDVGVEPSIPEVAAPRREFADVVSRCAWRLSRSAGSPTRSTG
jgi:hypothetical protein